MHDDFTISGANFPLIDRADQYFKRELPVDKWQSLHGTGHPSLPTLRIRRSKKWRGRIAKLSPISLQAGLIHLDAPDESVFRNKTADIFFAGSTKLNSTVRQEGAQQLRRLSERGIRVDIPSERLDQSEFFERMSHSWLAWSPSGLGWDCYRHYEAPQCLAVPVINYPTIIRHQPLEEGVHAVFYSPEGDSLLNAVETALVDKERLKRMALAGRNHVQAHHAGPAFCDQIIQTAMKVLIAKRTAT
jgi:hypothetical protein